MEGPSATAARNRLRSARSPGRRGRSPAPPGARGRREHRRVGDGRGVARESAAEAVATGAEAGVGAGGTGGALRFRPARNRPDRPTSPRRSRISPPVPSGVGRPNGSPASPDARPPDRHRIAALRSCTSRFFGPRHRCSPCGKPSFPVRRSMISSNRNWLACCRTRRTPQGRPPPLVQRPRPVGANGGNEGGGSVHLVPASGPAPPLTAPVVRASG